MNATRPRGDNGEYGCPRVRLAVCGVCFARWIVSASDDAYTCPRCPETLSVATSAPLTPHDVLTAYTSPGD